MQHRHTYFVKSRQRTARDRSIDRSIDRSMEIIATRSRDRFDSSRIIRVPGQVSRGEGRIILCVNLLNSSSICLINIRLISGSYVSIFIHRSRASVVAQVRPVPTAGHCAEFYMEIPADANIEVISKLNIRAVCVSRPRASAIPDTY